MKDDTKQAVRDLAYYSSLGFSIVLAIFIGLFSGIYLDGKFGTQPVLTFVFLGLGIAAGFRNIFHAMNKVRRSDKPKDENTNRHK
ncbi:MAG: AtpZ/AtpI family protein [Thermodesulfobacteriota bacterium]|nr:AtpZ/AtpI family protein [Thermodesulfobacteriota bacterium]